MFIDTDVCGDTINLFEHTLSLFQVTEGNMRVILNPQPLTSLF